jgi:hypothetical protein
MDLTVNSKIIASVHVQSVQLIPILGAFEMAFSLAGTVHGMSDGMYRWLTIAGARITMRTKAGQSIELGRAVPDNDMVVRQADNTSRTDFALKLLLQPYQLENLEVERNGSDLHLGLKLLARGNTNQNEGADWEEYLGEMAVPVPESAWIAQLNQSKAGRLLLLEIRLPVGTLRHPSERHLLRAQELLAEGDWRNCVSECRQFAEELGGARLAPAIQMLCNDRRAMTKDQREALILASLQHYGHIAVHPESKHGELDYSRADAKLALSLAASLAEYHFN